MVFSSFFFCTFHCRPISDPKWLFWNCLDKVSTEQQIFIFFFPTLKPLNSFFFLIPIFNPRIAGTQPASQITWRTKKMITEVGSYSFKWRTRFRLLRPCWRVSRTSVQNKTYKLKRSVINQTEEVILLKSIRQLKQPRRRRQQKPHKLAYLTMKNRLFPRFARAFFSLLAFWRRYPSF